MSIIVLTQNNTFIIGQVAWLLGKIMEGIFIFLNFIRIPNIGLAIILFTIVANVLMLPLTIRQQKFSKLSAIMNPEIQEIEAKYKGKKDSQSMTAKNQEVQAVHAKYGVSASGTCVQLLIQMPIMFALYQVINAIPAYVGKVREAFFPLVDKMIATVGTSEFIQKFSYATRMYANRFANESFLAGDTEFVQNTYIDVLNRASTTELNSIAAEFPTLTNDVNHFSEIFGRYNNFLGLNIGNSPQNIVKEAWVGKESGMWLLIIGAICIPLLSAITQIINVKLMPQQNQNRGNEQQGTMASSMKTMNMIMPIVSAWFCFSLPSGMGIYWIAGSVVRSIQQIIINRHLDKMDFSEIIKSNSVKSAKKIERMKQQQERMNAYANMKTRNIQSKASVNTTGDGSIGNKIDKVEDREAAVKKSTEYYSKENAGSGSIASRANMVKQYNEKSSNKSKTVNKEG